MLCAFYVIESILSKTYTSFYYFCIFDVIITLAAGNRCFRTKTGKFEPVYQFRNRIDQTGDSDNDKRRGTHARRIEQRNQPGQQYSHRNNVESARHRRPSAGSRQRGYLLHTTHHEDKAQHERQQIGKKARHNNQP